MKMRYAILAVACAASGAVWADETPEAVSGTCSYALDTMGDTVAIKEAGDMPVSLWRSTGDTVTAVDSSESQSTVASTSWTPSSGGLWTLRRRTQLPLAEEVTATVRHSLTGTQGAGTAASPAKIVDAEELVDEGAGAGYVFSPEGTAGLLAAIDLPDGCGVESAGDGLWRLFTSYDGCLYRWGEAAYSLDALAIGPDRKLGIRDIMPVAYSGDNWIGDVAAASTVTFIAPDGTTTLVAKTGTGADAEFRLDKPGRWTIRLSVGGVTKGEASIVVTGGFTLIVR